MAFVFQSKLPLASLKVRFSLWRRFVVEIKLAADAIGLLAECLFGGAGSCKKSSGRAGSVHPFTFFFSKRPNKTEISQAWGIAPVSVVPAKIAQNSSTFFCGVSLKVPMKCLLVPGALWFYCSLIASLNCFSLGEWLSWGTWNSKRQLKALLYN